MDADKAVDDAYDARYQEIVRKSKVWLSWESQLDYIIEKMEGQGAKKWDAKMKNLDAYDIRLKCIEYESRRTHA